MTIETINKINVGDLINIAPLSNTVDKFCTKFDTWCVTIVHKNSLVLKNSDGKTREIKKISLLWEIKNGLAKR